jgi:transposase
VIRQIVNAALKSLSADFGKLYSPIGRGSIPPERLMRAMLLQAFYSIRSERQLVERIDYDLLFRWFVGLGIEDAVRDATTFSKNRDRLLEGEVASKFLTAVLSQNKVKRLLSSDHFSVDGTLLEAWASPKSFGPKMALASRQNRIDAQCLSDVWTLVMRADTNFEGFAQLNSVNPALGQHTSMQESVV